MEDQRENKTTAPSPEAIKKAVEGGESFVSWIVNIIRSNNWVKKLLLLDALVVTFLNPILLKIWLSQAIPEKYWTYFGLIVGLISVAAVIVGYRSLPRHTDWVTRDVGNRSLIKGLLPFDSGDAILFRSLQREDVIRECLAGITDPSYRFGILSGESGNGKTSLLQAGIRPGLLGQKYRCVYVRLSDLDPIVSIRQAFTREFHLQREIVDSADFLSLLKSAANQDANPLVLLFDQFEQFFVHHKAKNDRRAFIQSLTVWFQDHSSLLVKVLVCVRSDFSSRLVELQKAIGYSLGPQQNWLLEKFEPEQASEILRVIARNESISIDESFVRRFTEEELADKEDGLVSPVNIQIWAWMIAGQAKEDERAFNRHANQKLGGIEGLLEGFLTRTLQTRETDRRRQVAIKVLLALTDLERNTRTGVLTLEDLKARLSNTLSTPEVREAVEWLERGDVRLITPVRRGSAQGYELAHERLIPALRRIAGKELSSADHANQLLDRRVNEWLGNNRASRYLLTWREWWLIQKQRPYLVWGKQKTQKDVLLGKSRLRFTRRASFLVLLLVGLIVSQLTFSYLSLERDFSDRVVVRRGLPWLSFLPLLGGDIVLDTGISINDLAPEKRQNVQGLLHYEWGVSYKSGILERATFVDSIRLPVLRALLLCQVGNQEAGLLLLQEKLQEKRTSYGGRSEELSAFKQVVQGNPNLAGKVFEPLLAALKTLKSTELRDLTPVLEQVAQAEPKLVLEPMLIDIQDSDKEVRWASLVALRRAAQVDPKLMLGPLLNALRDSNQYLRWGAAAALGKLAQADPASSSKVLEALLPTLKDSDAEVRGATAAALGRVALAEPNLAKRVVEPTLILLRDESDTTRWGAVLGLERAIKADPSVASVTIDEILGRLKDSSWQVRKQAISALGRAAQTDRKLAERIIASILSAINSQSKNVSSFPSYDDRRMPLYNKLSDFETISSALGRAVQADPSGALEPLLRARYDENFNVNSPAVAALGQVALSEPSLAKEVLEPVMAMAHGGENTGVVKALERLAQANPKIALKPLLDLLNNNVDMRPLSIRALGKLAEADPNLAETIFEPLLDTIEDGNANVRSATATALGSIAEAKPTLSSRIIEPLLRALKDSTNEVRDAAAGALGTAAQIDDKVRERTFQLLTDYDVAVRNAMREPFIRILVAKAEKEPDAGKFLLDHLEGRRLLLDTGDVRSYAAYRSVVIGALARWLASDKPKALKEHSNLRQKLEESRDHDHRLHLRIAAWRVFVEFADLREQREQLRDEI